MAFFRRYRMSATDMWVACCRQLEGMAGGQAEAFCVTSCLLVLGLMAGRGRSTGIDIIDDNDLVCFGGIDGHDFSQGYSVASEALPAVCRVVPPSLSEKDSEAGIR